MADTVIRAGIAYNFYTVPYSIPSIKNFDKKIITLHKTVAVYPNALLISPHNSHTTYLESKYFHYKTPI